MRDNHRRANLLRVIVNPEKHHRLLNGQATIRNCGNRSINHDTDSERTILGVRHLTYSGGNRSLRDCRSQAGTLARATD